MSPDQEQNPEFLFRGGSFILMFSLIWHARFGILSVIAWTFWGRPGVQSPLFDTSLFKVRLLISLWRGVYLEKLLLGLNASLCEFLFSCARQVAPDAT